MTASQIFVLFTVDTCRCALPAGSVQEILPFPDLFRPPGTPRVVAGFLNLGGEAVAVLEASVLFDPAAERKAVRERAEQHLLLLDTPDGAPIALAVDRVTDVASFRTMETAPETEARLPQDASSLRFRHDGEVVHLISVDGLLQFEARRRAAELAEQAQARLAAWEDAT